MITADKALEYDNPMFSTTTLKNLEFPPISIHRGFWEIGIDNSGNPDRIPVIIVQGAQKGPTIWIQGSIHGDEPSSSWTVTSLAQEVDPQQLKGRLILLPILNISAFRNRQTPTPIDNIELYKAFPGNREGTYTQHVASIIEEDFLALADYLIDVHAGTAIHFCVEFTSFPGGMEGSRKAEELALATDSPIIVERTVRSEIENHLMFMWACSKGIPSIMISMGGHRRLDAHLVDPLIKQCLSAMRFLQMIPGEPGHKDKKDILDGIVYSHCKKGGFVFNEAQIGDWMVKDQIICTIKDIFGKEVEIIRCPHEKALLIEAATGVLYPGELVAEFFLPKP